MCNECKCVNILVIIDCLVSLHSLYVIVRAEYVVR
jgi:hypothetical protein